MKRRGNGGEGKELLRNIEKPYELSIREENERTKEDIRKKGQRGEGAGEV